MAKFDIHNSAVLKSGKPTIIDLPCGYATRCFKVADNGQKYYGLDLPIVIDEMKELTSKIMTEKQKE
jgi:O-methyltransferase involved in polyketide biosynthesis